MLNDFKPALLFLTKFLVFYFLTNTIYGIYTMSFGDLPDSITKGVSMNAAIFLNQIEPPVSAEVNVNKPTVSIKKGNDIILDVFEGCNGVNVMIVFVAFMIAYGGPLNKLIWFLISGIIIIYFANITRLSLLYYVAQHYKSYFYFVHKYLFTAVLYLIVFCLWAIWVVKFSVVRVKDVQ